MDLAMMQMNMRRCFVCPICQKLFRQVTIIEQCRHRFCFKCILTKINEEGIHNCPVCNIHLGSAPLQILRIDHSWQSKVDSFNDSKSEGEVVKETTKISEDSRNEMMKGFDVIESSTPFLNQSKKRAFHPLINSQIPQASSYAYTSMRSNENQKNIRDEFKSKQYFRKNNRGKEEKPSENMRDMWRAVMEHGKQYTMKHAQGQEAKHLVTKDEDVAFSSKLHHRLGEFRVSQQDEENPNNVVRYGGFNPTRPVVDGSINYEYCNEKVTTFWFSLVASDNQKSKAPLKQISSKYLRVRDGNITVLSIKKYIMKKLKLRSENEVEISLQGRLLLPNLEMRKVVDLWLQTTAASEKKTAILGSSAHHFVMPLSYARTSLSI